MMTTVDTEARFLHITGTSIPKVLGTFKWAATLEAKHNLALAEITGLSDFKGNAYTEAGHRDEPLAAEWYRVQRQLSPKDIIMAPFKTSTVLPFLGVTVDRLIESDHGIAEMKYWAGQRNTCKVDLQGHCPYEYMDQCYLQMLCYERSYCDIVVSSSINRDYARLYWSNDWWKDAVPIIQAFYNKYLRWYWEDDASQCESMRLFLQTRLTNSNLIEKFLQRRPTKEMITLMRNYRTSSFLSSSSIDFNKSSLSSIDNKEQKL